MKLLRQFLDSQGRWFARGSRMERLHPLYEATDTFFYTPDKVAPAPTHVRDALDLKRMMSVVVIALIPCVFMALYNTGLQANRALALGAELDDNWRVAIMNFLGVGFSPGNPLACMIHGALYFFPVLIVSYAVGGAWEVLFAIVRRHEVNEGFFVTGILFPLILPATIPLWQVALGVSFGVVIGKEVFGGTGMNILNPALTARAFLFFSYAREFSGDMVWIASVDGYSGPTLLALAAETGRAALVETGSAWGAWFQAFIGLIPGVMGETSTLACLAGAALLIVTRVGSWRIMLGVVIGTVFVSVTLNLLAGQVRNPMFDIPFWWHFVLGGWAFGTVFMATDPVTATFSEKGKWFYGAAIGALVVLIRVVNPAFPEGIMLAILFMNVFAATIDHFIVKKNIQRRAARNATA